jgi:hypothetical protein
VIAIAVAFVLVVIVLVTNTRQGDKIVVLEEELEWASESCRTKFEELRTKLQELEDNPLAECVAGLCENFPDNLNSLNLLGCWNANANIPIVVSSIGDDNDAYIVCEAGSTTVDGQDDWGVGDLLVFRDGVWIKNDGTPEPCPLCDLEHEEYVMLMAWNNEDITPDFNITITLFLLGEGFVRMIVPEVLVDTTKPSFLSGARSIETAAFPIPEDRRPLTPYHRHIVSRSAIQGERVGPFVFRLDGTLLIRPGFGISDKWDTDDNPPNQVGWHTTDFI